MKYKLAIFDLDGTILNTLDDLHGATNAALASMGYPDRSLNEVRMFVGNGVRKLIERAVPAGTCMEDISECLSRFREYYVSHVNVKTKPYDGINALLADLRAEGLKIGVFSNKFDAGVQLLIKAHFDGLVDLALGESALVPKKPDPTGARELMAIFGAKEQETVYIGDSDVDIETAQNARLRCLCVAWGFRAPADLEKSGAKEIARSAGELKKMILAD